MFILFLFKDSSFYWTGNKVYGILKEQEEDFWGDLLDHWKKCVDIVVQ